MPQPADAEALAALLDDVPQENLLPGICPALSSWLETHGSRDAAAALRLARCEMAADHRRADEIFTTTLALHRATEPIATARWCVQTRRPAEARSLLASLPDPDDPESFNLRRLAYEQSGDTEAWAALLADPPADAFLPEILCERAHVANLAGDPGARKSAEDEALRTAAAFPADDALIRLARSARRRCLTDLAHRAWIEAIRRQSGPLPLASHIKPVVEALAASKREMDLLEILTIYRLIEPDNPVIRVQHGYLSCLNGHTTPAHLIRDLTPVHTRLPDALPVRCVLALAHLLEHRRGDALTLTKAKAVDWAAASPAYRAIRGIALAANGHADEAAAFLDNFPWDDLLPSEKRILRGLAETAAERSHGTGQSDGR